MEANYFTILWWFLPYIDMDQPGCTCVSPLSEALGENVSLPFSASKAFLHSLVYDTFLFLQNQQCIIFITLSFFHCNIFFFFFLIHSSVQLLSRVWLFATPWIAARQVSLSITNSQSSLKLTSIESVMPSSHFILCRPVLLLPPIPPSITVFSNESTLCMRWPKYWGFSFSIIPSKEIPGLISFRMDWLDLLAVQETLKSFLQHHSS